MRPRSRNSRLLSMTFLALLCLGTGGCLIQHPAVSTLDVANPPMSVQSPVKAHLLDGSTVVYPTGAVLLNRRINGPGQRFALGSSIANGPTDIPLDSVIGMEAFTRRVDVPATVLASSVGTAAGVFGTAVLAVLIFGSCPTFYADSAGTSRLQGEGFSYSVAPLLEQRDVDRLHITPDAQGRLVIRVKNEAMETHYINHMEIVEARHHANEVVVPDNGGRPLAVTTPVALRNVRDRSGRDISTAVRAPDDVVFATSSRTIDGATERDLDDWIDLTVAAGPGADSVAIVMDMRNSLLNTVLLYDHVLAAPGLKSLDYLGKDLENIATAVDLAKWYNTHMGTRVSVLDGGKWRQVARIGDTGPIAFHHMALLVPAVRSQGDSVRVRLSFVADEWRIDAINSAPGWRRPEVRTIPATSIAMEDPSQNAAALNALHDPDDAYLVTTPGNTFRLVFDPGAAGSDARTFMLASQGYYTEWVRGDWIAKASGVPFVPSEAALLKALRGWRSKQADMERRFYASRIGER